MSETKSELGSLKWEIIDSTEKSRSGMALSVVPISSGISLSIPEFHFILCVFLNQTVLKGDEVQLQVRYFIWPAQVFL